MAGKVRLTEARRTVVAEFYRPPHGITRLHSLVVIEAKTSRDGKPYTSRDYYDVDWSRTYGYIFDQSGCGGGRDPVKVRGLHYICGDEIDLIPEPCTWCDGHHKERKRRTKLIRRVNRTRRLQSLPRGIELRPGEDLLDYLERDGIQGDSVWCSICCDHFPESSLCQHIWWCDRSCWWSTPSDRCKCKDREECNA